MRSLNMQKLTNQLAALYARVVIYGIGDEAHKRSPSGHNEDDTPGSKPEQEDPDSKPEHRAIDVMISGAFTKAAAWLLVTALVTIKANQDRLLYVIFDGWIWRRNGGWVKEVYTGSDKHRDHVHVSGNWPDDDNTAAFVLTGGGTPTGAVGGSLVSNFMIQVNGDPTIYLSDGFKYRGLTDWNAFLTYRDVFKWPYVVVSTPAELTQRAGRYDDGSAPAQAVLSDAQVARIEAAAKAGALGGAGGVDLDALRAIVDDETISEEEIAERFGAKV